MPEAPCQVPRERTLFYDLQVADATQSSGQNVAERHAEDCQTLGQFLQTNCFNLSRQCKNPKCREGVLRHEQCFSHHGGRFSLRVQQLPPDHGLPQEGVYTWSVAGGTTSPVHALSASTLSMSLGRFLESNFYNTSAISRAPGCTHALHRHHERFIACGGLVCSLKFQKCIVFSVTPPIAPQLLSMQPAVGHTPATVVTEGQPVPRSARVLPERRNSQAGSKWPFSKQPSPGGGGGEPLSAEDLDASRSTAGPSSVAALALTSAQTQAEVMRIT